MASAGRGVGGVLVDVEFGVHLDPAVELVLSLSENVTQNAWSEAYGGSKNRSIFIFSKKC